MPLRTRRRFITGLGTATATSLIGPHLRCLETPAPIHAQTSQFHVYVARNGTPVTNVQRVIALAGSIQRFVDYNDVMVLKPNGQWPRQGYTHNVTADPLSEPTNPAIGTL